MVTSMNCQHALSISDPKSLTIELIQYLETQKSEIPFTGCHKKIIEDNIYRFIEVYRYEKILGIPLSTMTNKSQNTLSISSKSVPSQSLFQLTGASNEGNSLKQENTSTALKR
jgi:hypothetical protein